MKTTEIKKAEQACKEARELTNLLGWVLTNRRFESEEEEAKVEQEYRDAKDQLAKAERDLEDLIWW